MQMVIGVQVLLFGVTQRLKAGVQGVVYQVSADDSVLHAAVFDDIIRVINDEDIAGGGRQSRGAKTFGGANCVKIVHGIVDRFVVYQAAVVGAINHHIAFQGALCGIPDGEPARCRHLGSYSLCSGGGEQHREIGAVMV